MSVSRAQISNFLKSGSIAIAGVSRTRKKFGRMIFDELRKKGYRVHPINPLADEIDGQKCYHSVHSLPNNINAILIATPKEQTDLVLQNAIDKGILNIWVQKHSNTKDTITLANDNGQQIISNKCILMFAEPITGVHQFHRNLNGLFGLLPK